MSGGRAKKRRDRKWHPKLRVLTSKCMNCGEEGAHFVPPSFGDPGFFMCKSKYRMPEIVD